MRYQRRISEVLAAKISLPILFELFSRQVEDRPTELRYTHEDFLRAHGVDRASDLSKLALQFERSHLIYYLRYVSVVRTMQLSFASTREVEEERVAICTVLKQLDPAHAGAYDAEIREITRRQIISQGLQQVEQSKIWIDQEPLKHWAERHLKEDFGRYVALRAAGVRSPTQVPTLGKSPIPPEAEANIPEVPSDEAGALLLRIVSQFVSQCFLHGQHGLDSYLSLRVRHGVLSGQLRAPLEAEKIVTLQKERGSGDYVPNRYWLRRLSDIDPQMAILVDLRLQQFSRDFDSLIEGFAKDYIQIQTDAHPKGLFKPMLSRSEVMLAGLDVHSDTTFDSFTDLCTSLFWESVEDSLKPIRDHLDGPVLRDLNALFISLLKEVESITSQVATPELDNAIRNAQTHARHALEQVKLWFQQPKPLQPSFMNFQSLADISMQAVKNMYRDFGPDVTYTIDGNLPLFFQLQKFTDILIILLDNVWRHCGMRSPKIEIKASLLQEGLQIEVINELAAGVVTSKSETRVNEIRERIAEGRYHRAVSSEGGTGLMKIRNIVGSDSGNAPKVDFGFRGETQFYAQLQLPSTVVDMDRTGEEQRDYTHS